MGWYMKCSGCLKKGCLLARPTGGLSTLIQMGRRETVGTGVSGAWRNCTRFCNSMVRWIGISLTDQMRGRSRGPKRWWTVLWPSRLSCTDRYRNLNCAIEILPRDHEISQRSSSSLVTYYRDLGAKAVSSCPPSSYTSSTWPRAVQLFGTTSAMVRR